MNMKNAEWIKIREAFKRRTAALLSVIMVMQLIFTGSGLSIAWAENGQLSSGKNIQYEFTGNPAEAFEKILIEILNGVTENGDIHMTTTVNLDDTWTGIQYENFLETYDGLDQQDFEGGESIVDGEPPANTIYDNYDEYINAIPDNQLRPLSFSAVFASGLLDENIAGTTGPCTDDKGVVLGTWEIVKGSDGKMIIRTDFEKAVYYRIKAVISFSADLGLQEWYEPGTEIEKKDSSDAEINLTFKENQSASPADANYELEKSVQVDGEKKSDTVTLNDKREFSYVLAAKASNPLTAAVTYAARKASDSNIAREYANITIDDLILDAEEMEHYRKATGSDADWDWSEYYESEKEYIFWKSLYTYLADTPSLMNAGSESPSLVGKKIEDTLPSGLELVGVEAKIGSGEWVALEEDGYVYNAEDRKLSYTIGENISDGSSVYEASLRIHVKVSDELYNEHLKSGSSNSTYSFPNRGFIKGEDERNLAVSNRVAPKVRLEAALAKNGAKVDSKNGTFLWTLNVNSQFDNGEVKLWVVDHIENIGDTHHFYVGYGVYFNRLTSSEGHIEIEEVTPTNPLSYEQVKNVTGIEEIVSEGGEGKAYYYTYNYTEAGKNKTDAILLIPLHTEYLKEKVEITYETSLSETLLSNPDSYGKNMVMENEAKILWKWPEGVGPGTEEGSATIDKGVDTTIDVLTKAAGEYKKKDSTIIWEFEINRDGAVLDEAVFYDEFTIAELEPVGLAEGRAIRLTRLSNQQEEILVPKLEGDPPDPPFYTYGPVEGSDNKKMGLSIYLGNLKAETGYEFDLTTKVKAATMNSEGDTNRLKIRNEASLSGKVAGKPVTIRAAASTEIENTLIQKTVVPVSADNNGIYYDYADNLMKWQITVNQNSMDIQDAKITDLLPVGLAFSPDNMLSNCTLATEGNRQRITISLGDINAPVPLEFTTKVTEDFLKTVKNGTTYQFHNTATLTGTTSGAEVNTSDSAINKVVFNPLDKSGQYVVEPTYSYEYIDTDTDTDTGTATMTLTDVPVLHWQLFVNRNKVDISGSVIKDMMENASTGECFMELVPSTMEVYEVNLGANGAPLEGAGNKTLIAKIDPDTGRYIFKNVGNSSSCNVAGSSCDTSGFSYKIADGEYKKTLLFEFDTILTDDVLANNMTNSASITGALNTEVTSPKPGNAKDFFVDNYNSAQGVNFIKIHKVSSRQSNGGNFALRGAVFKLEEMKLKSSGAPQNLGDWEINSSVPPKEKTTNRRGNLSFMFLKPDKMYRVTEVTPPAGYELAKKTWYFVPRLENTNVDDYPENPQTGLQDPLSPENTYQISIAGAGENYRYEEITNGVPEGGGGTLVFQKLGYEGQILPGVTFRLRHNKGELDPITATSDANGIVTFKEIEALQKSNEYYILEEVEAPTGYNEWNGSVKVQATYKADKNEVAITWENTPNITSPVPGNMAVSFAIENKEITQNFSFTKTDQNGIALPGVTFSVMRRGNAGNPMIIDVEGDSRVTADQKNQLVSYKTNTVTSDSSGKVELFNLPYGDYVLTETSVPDPGIAERFMVAAKVRAKSVTMWYKPLPETTANMQWEDPAQGSSWTLMDGKKLANTLPYGYVNIKKVAANWNDDGTLTSTGSPLSGAVFNIYRESDNQAGYSKGDQEVITGLTTDSTGSFKISDLGEKLIAGKTYYLLETRAPEGYVKNETAFPFEVPKAEGNGSPRTIWLGSDKTSVNPSEAGAVTSENGDSLVFVNGQAYFGTLSLEKTSSHDGRLLSGAEFDIYTAVGQDKVKVARLVEDGAGGRYILGEGGNPAYTRRENSVVKLIAGSYWLVETKAPHGYKLPEAAEENYWYFQINQSNYETPIDTVYGSNAHSEPKPFTNDIQKANVKIHKQVEQEFSHGIFNDLRTRDGNFTFKLEGTSDEGESYSATAVTNQADSMAVFENVPKGTYHITEELTEDQKKIYKAVQEVDVIVGSSSANETVVTYTYNGNTSEPFKENSSENRQIVRNSLKKGGLEVWKYTVDRMKTPGSLAERSLAGAKFTLTTKPGSAFHYTAEITSDAQGKVKAENLPVGTYILTETSAPEGYMLGSTAALEIQVEDGKVTSVDGSVGEILKLENVPIKGMLRLTKVDAEDRTISLDGVTFALYAEDGTKIGNLVSKENQGRREYVLPDPQEAAKTNGDVWKYMTYYDETTQDKPSLYYGKYYLQEITTLPGYILDQTRYPVDIHTDGQTVVVANTTDGSGLFINRKGKGSITITKQAEKISESLAGKMSPGEGFGFRIWGNSADGTPIEQYLKPADVQGAADVQIRTGGADTGIYVTTGGTGQVILSNVQVGDYHVTEMENEKNHASGAYVRDTKVYDMRIRIEEQTGQILPENEKVTHGELKLDNFLKRGEIRGQKQTNGGTGLPGAVIGLFPAGTTSFVEANLYYGSTATSDSDGNFVFSHIPYGEYVVAELKAPSGYNLNTRTSYQVSITENGQVQTDGYLAESGAVQGTERTAMVIVNTRRSSDGGGNRPTTPTNPAAPVNPPVPEEEATEPAAPSEPENSEEPSRGSEPEEPTLPDIPTNPDNTPSIENGVPIEIYRPGESEPIYRGSYDPNHRFTDLDRGTYELYILSEEALPLGRLLITIGDDGIPLALPKTGDTSIPLGVFGALLAGSAIGAGALLRRKKEEDE